ncbi:MAG: hypothetical protein EOM63_02640 [Clostridia bacterium]|nr:hypothetical protein [Clostridia bacterium]
MWGEKGRMAGILTLFAVTAVLLYGAVRTQPAAASAPVMGVVYASSEDEWKDEQYAALTDAAQAAGFSVMGMPVERTQAAQIEALRALTVYQVDVIVFSPVVESGWDNVLREAREAGVPVIAMDKSVRGGAASYVGFDYEGLAREAMAALLRHPSGKTGIAELYGTLGSSPAREIARGCRETAGAIHESLCADGMRSRGYEIMESLRLEEVGYVVCHNDAMARGAVDYLYDHGLDGNIAVCAFGGGQDVLRLLDEGRIAVVGVCDNASLARKTVETARQLVDDPTRTVRRFAEARVQVAA